MYLGFECLIAYFKLLFQGLINSKSYVMFWLSPLTDGWLAFVPRKMTSHRRFWRKLFFHKTICHDYCSCRLFHRTEVELCNTPNQLIKSPASVSSDYSHCKLVNKSSTENPETTVTIQRTVCLPVLVCPSDVASSLSFCYLFILWPVLSWEVCWLTFVLNWIYFWHAWIQRRRDKDSCVF